MKAVRESPPWRRLQLILSPAILVISLTAAGEAQSTPAGGSDTPKGGVASLSASGEGDSTFAADENTADLDPAGLDSSGSANSFTKGPNDWVHRWLRTVDKVRSEQPHYASPLITTHVLLVQQFRFDSWYQSANPSGAETNEYGAGRGLEIIPNTRMEVQVGIPPYYFHQSRNTPDGFGDVSVFLKFRVASAPDGKGGYFFGFFLGGSFPSGSPPNGMGHTIWTPMVAAAKRWRWFDWQSNFGGVLPQSGTATLGRQIIFNNTFQFNAAKIVWPEVESNSTFYVEGPHSGNSQTFLTPGLILGPFRLGERLHFTVGGGLQTAVSGFYLYNHRWIWTARFPF